MYLSLYCKGSKRVTQGFTVRGSWRPNKDCNILTPLLCCVFLVLLMLNWRPGGSAFFWVLAFSTTSCHQQVSKTTGAPRAPSAGSGFPYHILSATSLVPNSSGAPRAPSGLSLPHLISNFSGPQLIWGPKSPLCRAFSTTSYQQLLSLQLSDFLSWLSYIIFQCPLNRPLNLWNGMFDCHQAEITVMQFTGHSLPVHQSMSVPWEFLPCPISSAKSTHTISFDYWPLECVTSFWRITLEWHVWLDWRSKYNTYE